MPVFENKNAKDKNKRYYYQFYTGEVVNGKRKKITKRGFKSRPIADRALAAHMTAYHSGGYVEPSKMSFADYLKDWLKAKQRNLGEQTIELYELYLSTHIIPSLGKIPLAKLSAHHIEMFVDELHEKQLAPSTIKRIFSVVNAALNAAERKDIVVKNVANKIEKPKASQRREIDVWTPEQTSDFLFKTRGASRYWIAAYLAIMTGMRQGEILGLRWSDIDYEKRNATIRQTVTRKRTIKPGAKNKSSVRSVALSPETIEILKDYRKHVVLPDQLKAEKYNKNDLVVCTAIGGPATARVIQKMWDRLLKKHDMPRITFHDLRHVHASLLISQGVHIKVISERLGHSSVSITMDRYGHLMPNMQNEAADGLDSIIKKVRG